MNKDVESLLLLFCSFCHTQRDEAVLHSVQHVRRQEGLSGEGGEWTQQSAVSGTGQEIHVLNINKRTFAVLSAGESAELHPRQLPTVSTNTPCCVSCVCRPAGCQSVNNLLLCRRSGRCRLQQPKISSSDRWSKSWRESNRVASR